MSATSSRTSSRLVAKAIALLVVATAFASGIAVFAFPQADAHAAPANVTRLANASDMPAASSGVYVYMDAISESNYTVQVNNSAFVWDKSYSDGARHNVIRTRDSVPDGVTRSYNGSASNPLIRCRWTNAGYTSDGDRIDVVLDFVSVSVTGLDGIPVIIADYWDDTSDTTGDGFDLSAWFGSATSRIRLHIYEAGTSTPVSGAAFRFDMSDIDVVSSNSEGFVPISGIDGNRVYMSSSSTLRTVNYPLNGQNYTKFEATTDGQASWENAISFYVSGGSAEFVWTGKGCGTYALESAFPTHAPSFDPPSKSSNQERKRGESATFSISEFIPYTSYNGGKGNTYSTIRMSDKLDAALDNAATTLTVYRTDTLNGTSEKNDTSNWTIAKSGQTITATHKTPSSAGGKYRFVITTKVRSNADLSSYQQATMSSGGPGRSFTNTATMSLGTSSKKTNTVTVKIPTANVRYTIIGTDFPSDGKTPPSPFSGYAGEKYTVAKTLTTKDEGAWYFDGWYLDAAMKQKAPATLVLSNGTTTLYGKWLPGSIALEKEASADVLDDAHAGDKIEWTLTATNDGKSMLDAVVITDPLLGGTVYDGKTAVLSAGREVSISKEYMLTQEDVDRGYVENTASVSADDPIDNQVSDTAVKRVEITQSPSIKIVKTAYKDTLENAHAGDAATFKLTVTNTGNVTLHDVSIDDPMCGGAITISKTELGPDESVEVSVSHALTQEEIDNGSVLNTATAKGKSPKDVEVSSTGEDDVILPSNPSIALAKEANKELLPAPVAGDAVSYSFTVTNTGNTTLHDIVLDDPKISSAGGAVNISKTTLIPGQSTVANVTYYITQADIDTGIVHNVANVSGIDPHGTKVVANDEEDVSLTRSPSVSLDKSADRTHIASAKPGEVVEYTLIVTNTGNTTLSSGDISDAMFGGSLAAKMSKRELEPGDTVKVVCEHTVTQEDIDAGLILNTAATTWDAPDGSRQTDDDNHEIAIDRHPSIILTKEVVGETEIDNAAEGDIVEFLITVENTGDVTLRDVKVTDALPGVVLDTSQTAAVLAPGGKTTAKATYALTQADIDRGDVENIANVSATPPDGLEPVGGEDDANVVMPANPSIALDKSVVPDTVAAAGVGDTVEYTIVATNTGNVTLYGVVIEDPLLGGSLELSATVLAPGESVEVVREYALTQDDIDAGVRDNTATTKGTPPNGAADVVADASAHVDIERLPGLSLDKSVAPADGKDAGDLAVGDALDYTFVIANTGNTTLDDVALNDELLGGGIPLDEAMRGVVMENEGGSDASDDMDSNHSAPDEGNDENSGDNAQTGHEANAQTDDNVSHSPEAGAEDAGSGADQGDDVGEAKPITMLAPGETLTVVVPYTLTQADFDNGRVDNTAIATAMPPTGEELSSEDTATIALPVKPEIELVKTSETDRMDPAHVGDEVAWTITATNTGNVSLKDLVLEDALDGIELSGTEALQGLVLAPGESVAVEARYALEEDDLDAGNVFNVATITATPVVMPEDGEDTVSAEAESEVVVVPEPKPAAAVAQEEIALPRTGMTIAGIAAVLIIAASAMMAAAIGRRRCGGEAKPKAKP